MSEAIRLLTAAEILAAPDAPVGERACDVLPPPWLVQHVRELVAEHDRQYRAIMRTLQPMLDVAQEALRAVLASLDFEAAAQTVRMAEGYVEEAKTPAEPDLAWSARAMRHRGGWPYADDARDLAAEWIADAWIANAFGGFHGHPDARAEVKRALWRIAIREGRQREELRRELVLAATPEAAAKVGSLPFHLCRRENPRFRKALADAVFSIVRRDVREMMDRPHTDLNVEDLPASDREVELQIQCARSATALSPREREIVAAMYENGGESEAAAEHVGLASSTVRVHLGRIRAKFRRAV